MALLAAAVWVALLAITGQQVECFNLDQNENVIRFFTGGNEPNSLFGFSLAPYSFSDNHTRYVCCYTKPEEACKLIVYLNITIGCCTRNCMVPFRLLHTQVNVQCI